MLVKCKFARNGAYSMARKVTVVCLALIWVLAGLISVAPPASALAYTFTQTDIGGAIPVGSQSNTGGSFPTYTVNGGGTGIGGTADSCTFTSLQQAGNIEFTAQVPTQTNTSPYAVAGLMVRQDLTSGSAMAVVGVSPKNGVNFTCRQAAGTVANTTLGPSNAAPTWVRLAISGGEAAGYTSSDGLIWSLVGKSKIALTGAYSVGLTVCSYVPGSPGSYCTATFSNLSMPVGVPQNSPDLVLWLRGDSGVTTSAGNVTRWVDQSPSGYVATQSTPSLRPTLTSSSINNLPAVSFNSGQYLNPGSGFANFTNGATIFVVSQQTLGGTLFSFSNASSVDDLALVLASNISYFVYNGSSQSSLNLPLSAAGPAALTQVVVSPNAGANTAGTLSYNGSIVSGSLNNNNNVVRTTNFIGCGAGGSGGWSGGALAELLIYNSSLSRSQIANVNAYLFSKYGVGSAPMLVAPTFNPPAAKYAFVSEASPPTVTIQSTPGTLTFYTVDGSPVSFASPVYTAPIPISQGGMEIQAASAFPGSTTLSPIGTANFQVSPTFFEVPTAGRKLWLSADAGVTANGSGQISNWYDVSGNNWSAVQPVTANMPVLGSLLLNQSPYVTFNGASSQYFTLPTNTIDFSSGADFFMVASVNTPTTILERLFDFGVTATTTNDLHLLAPTNTNILRFGTTASFISTAANVFPTTLPFQVLEGQQLGSTGGGNVYINLVNKATSASAPTAFSSAARPFNYIGADTTGAHPFSGSIAEFLAYNTVLSPTQQQYLYSYFANKYWMIQPPNPAATLTFVPPSGSHLALNQGQAAVVAPQGVTLHYTISPTVMPTVSSPVLSGPITPTANGTMQLNILPVAGGQPIPSSAQSATYTTP